MLAQKAIHRKKT